MEKTQLRFLKEGREGKGGEGRRKEERNGGEGRKKERKGEKREKKEMHPKVFEVESSGLGPGRGEGALVEQSREGGVWGVRRGSLLSRAWERSSEREAVATHVARPTGSRCPQQQRPLKV